MQETIKMRTQKKRTKGFSLIELMLVVAILGVLGLVVARNVLPYFFQSQQAVAKTNIETLKSIVQSFHMENHRLPESLDELLEPNEKHLNEPYIEKPEDLLDPWQNDYVYIINGSKFEIKSLGADGMEGGEGQDADISSLGENRDDMGF